MVPVFLRRGIAKKLPKRTALNPSPTIYLSPNFISKSRAFLVLGELDRPHLTRTLDYVSISTCFLDGNSVSL